MNSLIRNEKLVTYSTVVANIIYITFWLYWTYSGGLEFVGKLITLLLTPQQLLNLHWGTDWVTDRFFATLIISTLLLLTTFIIWKLNVKLLSKK